MLNIGNLLIDPVDTGSRIVYDEPRTMYAWDNAEYYKLHDMELPDAVKVYDIIPNRPYPVVTECAAYNHCGELVGFKSKLVSSHGFSDVDRDRIADLATDTVVPVYYGAPPIHVTDAGEIKSGYNYGSKDRQDRAVGYTRGMQEDGYVKINLINKGRFVLPTGDIDLMETIKSIADIPDVRVHITRNEYGDIVSLNGFYILPKLDKKACLDFLKTVLSENTYSKLELSFESRLDDENILKDMTDVKLVQMAVDLIKGFVLKEEYDPEPYVLGTMSCTDGSDCKKDPDDRKATASHQLLTNRELSEWLATGKGEYTWVNKDEIRHHFFGGHSYVHGHDDEPVEEHMRVRKWSDTEWHKPTREYCGLLRYPWPDTGTSPIQGSSMEHATRLDIKLPMLYRPGDKDTGLPHYILASGEHAGIRFYVCNINGMHPTAYIRIPDGMPLYGSTYDEACGKIDVHGGFTYSEDHLQGVANDDSSWFLGWDYGHCNDFAGYYLRKPNDYLATHTKKWSTEEIIEDCKKVCEAVLKLRGI